MGKDDSVVDFPTDLFCLNGSLLLFVFSGQADTYAVFTFAAVSSSHSQSTTIIILGYFPIRRLQLKFLDGLNSTLSLWSYNLDLIRTDAH